MTSGPVIRWPKLVDLSPQNHSPHLPSGGSQRTGTESCISKWVAAAMTSEEIACAVRSVGSGRKTATVHGDQGTSKSTALSGIPGIPEFQS